MDEEMRLAHSKDTGYVDIANAMLIQCDRYGHVNGEVGEATVYDQDDGGEPYHLMSRQQLINVYEYLTATCEPILHIYEKREDTRDVEHTIHLNTIEIKVSFGPDQHVQFIEMYGPKHDDVLALIKEKKAQAR